MRSSFIKCYYLAGRVLGCKYANESYTAPVFEYLPIQ